MISHSDAKSLLELVSPEISVPERLAAQGVALHESSYGAGWKEGHGAGSHNWGAIMRPSSDSGPFFETEDSNPSGAFVGHFKIYPDDAAGALDVVHVALKPNVRTAAVSGNLRGVAQAMFDNHYFTGTSQTASVNVLRYEAALRAAIEKIVAETGEANPFPKAPGATTPAPSSSVLPHSLPILRLGDSGTAVRLLRAIVERLDRSLMVTPGDKYDVTLAAAVASIQGTSGLIVDHLVGEKTWNALASRLEAPAMPGYT